LKKKEITIKLVSAYTSSEEEEQVYLQDFMEVRLKQFPDSTSILID